MLKEELGVAVAQSSCSSIAWQSCAVITYRWDIGSSQRWESWKTEPYTDSQCNDRLPHSMGKISVRRPQPSLQKPGKETELNWVFIWYLYSYFSVFYSVVVVSVFLRLHYFYINAFSLLWTSIHYILFHRCGTTHFVEKLSCYRCTK